MKTRYVVMSKEIQKKYPENVEGIPIAKQLAIDM
jgi:hypothetical protein